MRIVCQNENCSLDDIVIDVYAAVLNTDESTSDRSIFDEAYAFTVETNAAGVASFTRPGQYFSCTVDTSTLPSGYEIKNPTHFVFENDNSAAFELAEIENTDDQYVNSITSSELYFCFSENANNLDLCNTKSEYSGGDV